jgi:hypothetical protein
MATGHPLQSLLPCSRYTPRARRFTTAGHRGIHAQRRGEPPHRTPKDHGYCARVRQSTNEAPLSSKAPGTSWLRRYRYDVIWGAFVCCLLTAAFEVPHLHIGWLSPVIHQTSHLYRILADTAPLLALWLPHADWATAAAVVLAGVVVWLGPPTARSMAWRGLVPAAWITATAWTMALALIDGWKVGVVDRMHSNGGYLAMVPRVGGLPDYLRSFASHIPQGRPGSWDTTVAGHPAGALLTFVWLHRIGLSGPTWASLFCLGVGCSAAPAVVITVKALSGEAMARRVVPFVALAPAAVWIGVSADAYYAGVAAWGLALLALAGTGRARPVLSVAAGVLLGWTVYLNYGLVLMAIPALAILVATRNYRPVVPAALGALAVVALMTSLGFWWFDGLSMLRARYLSTIAMDRPFAYWVWGDLAALTCAIGLPAAIALRRAFDGARLRARSGLNLLLVSFVVTVLLADISALSKAETERIWLPFAVWLVAAPALLPRRSHRFCLVVQALGALVINSLLLTTW